MQLDPLLSPYGLWRTADGREVLFDRRYRPLWQRQGGKVRPADPCERVEFTAQHWFYDDATAPRRNIATRHRLRHVVADFLAGRSIDAHLRPGGPRTIADQRVSLDSVVCR